MSCCLLGLELDSHDAAKALSPWLKLCINLDRSSACWSACIAACPYNKPDFWHHRFIDAQNVIAPGWVHSIMREIDIVFGYGNVADPEKVKKFWKRGSKA